ncbi:MAG: substrate-binding domain-containing protein [Candidatus Sumerlaeia bacterium]
MKSLQVLEVLEGNSDAVARSTIQEATGIAPATLTRLLRRMTKTGRIERLERGYYASNGNGKGLHLAHGDNNGKDHEMKGNGLIYILAQTFRFFEKALARTEQNLSELGYMPVIKSMGTPLTELTERDLEPFEKAGGIMFFTALRLPKRIRHFVKEHRIPAVKIGLGEHWESDTICLSQEAGFYELTSRLLDEGAKSAIILENKWKHKALEISQSRVWGFEKATRERNIEPVRFLHDVDFQHPMHDKEELKARLDRMEKPIALVILNHKTLHDILYRLEAWGYELGRDITFSTIFGDDEYDDYEVLKSHVHMGIYQDHSQLGELAAEAMHCRMQNKEHPAANMQIHMPVGVLKNWDKNLPGAALLERGKLL